MTSSIPTPHQDIPESHKEAIKKISALSTDEIAKLKAFEALRYAVPEDGEIYELANLLNINRQTLYQWRLDPDMFEPDGTEKPFDPNGRRGIVHWFNVFILQLNGRFPAGAQFLLQWQLLQLAKAQAVQGHNALLATLQVTDELDELISEAGALEEKARTLKARIVAATGGAALGTT